MTVSFRDGGFSSEGKNVDWQSHCLSIYYFVQASHDAEEAAGKAIIARFLS